MRRRSRSNHLLPQGDVNVIPMMDILTTLLFFLLSAGSFFSLSYVPGQGMPAGVDPDLTHKPTFSLQVTFMNDRSATVWIGPVHGLKSVNDTHLKIFLTGFSGDESTGYLKKVEAADEIALRSAVQDILIDIKRSFPHQLQAVVAFSDRVPYQQVTRSIASVRSLAEKQQAFVLTNLIGQTELTKILFPEVVVAEWDAGPDAKSESDAKEGA